jgi:hypothetical protein
LATLLGGNLKARGVALDAKKAPARKRGSVIETNDLVRCISLHYNHSASCQKSAKKNLKG